MRGFFLSILEPEFGSSLWRKSALLVSCKDWGTDPGNRNRLFKETSWFYTLFSMSFYGVITHYVQASVSFWQAPLCRALVRWREAPLCCPVLLQAHPTACTSPTVPSPPTVSAPRELWEGEQLAPWKWPQPSRKVASELGTHTCRWWGQCNGLDAQRSPKYHTLEWMSLSAKKFLIFPIRLQPVTVSDCPEQSWKYPHACKHQQTKYTKSMHGYFW